jgi:hypothetical protein
MITAIAALLTAAAGLAAKFASPKPTGKPWMVGIVALAIVGVVLLVVALATPNREPEQSAPPAKPYQNQVVSICTEDREIELAFKRQTEELGQKVTSGDFSAIYSLPKLMTDTIVEEQGLADRLEALDAPADLEPVQSEAVSTWRRGIAVSRQNRDKLEKLAAASAGDALKFAQDSQILDSTEETRLESQKDVLLRKLGGSGCKPSP